MGFNISNVVNDILGKVGNQIGIGQFGGSSLGKSIGEGDITSGDVNLIDITAYNAENPDGVSLAGVAKEINVYESIFSPSVFATISILDAASLMQTYNIGESGHDWFVNLEFQTPGSSKTSKYTLHINSRSDAYTLPNLMGSVYTFNLCSTEININAGTLTTIDVKDQPHNAIQSLLLSASPDGLGTTKPIHIEQDADLPIDEPFVVSRPFVIIDNLRRLCVSRRNISSCFVFYEDVDGYHLNTLENMIQNRQSGLAGLAEDITGIELTDKVFFWDATRQTDASSTAYRNILAFNRGPSSDLQNEASMGGFRILARSFDPIQGGDWLDILDSEDVGPTNILIDAAGQPVQSASLRNARQSRARQDMTIKYADKPDQLTPEILTARMSFLADVARNVCRLHVYGDSELRLGDVIKTTFIEPTDIEGAGTTRTSGNYLVTRIRHIILNTDRPAHTTAMEVIKTGVVES